MPWTVEAYDHLDEVEFKSPDGERFLARVDSGRLDRTFWMMGRALSGQFEEGFYLGWKVEVPKEFRSLPAARRAIKFTYPDGRELVLVFPWGDQSVPTGLEAYLKRMFRKAAPKAVTPKQKEKQSAEEVGEQRSVSAHGDSGGPEPGRPAGSEEGAPLRFQRPGGRQQEQRA